MKKVKRRATAALLIAALLVVGLSVYLVRLADDGGAWASYFNGGTPGGTILDRNGVILYNSDENGYSFAEDWATRVSCYHLIGDANGNVRTGALRQFRPGRAERGGHAHGLHDGRDTLHGLLSGRRPGKPQRLSC